MKFSIFALALVSIFAFSSCDKDDDVLRIDSTTIQGTWNLTTYDADADVSIGIGPLAETTTTVSMISNSTVTVTFKEDGTWTSEGDYTLTTTTGSETEVEEVSGGVGSGSYSVADGELTINGLDAGDEADVESITLNSTYTPDTKVDLNGDLTETETDPFFGLDITLDLLLNMTLEK